MSQPAMPGAEGGEPVRAMIAYCGRPPAASFGDRFALYSPRYMRETIAETCSLGDALATAIMTRTGS